MNVSLTKFMLSNVLVKAYINHVYPHSNIPTGSEWYTMINVLIVTFYNVMVGTRQLICHCINRPLLCICTYIR